MDKVSLFDVLSQAKGKDVNIEKLYNDVMRKKTTDARIPSGVQFELTPICNFNCKFCYVRMSKNEVEQSGFQIMRFDQWKTYIDEIAKLDTHRLTFSGGECTLHPDFIELYRYAYAKGFEMGIITNGSAVTDEIFSMFEECPPKTISITMYGMSEETYGKICGNASAFPKVLKNIERLADRGFKVSLNYTVSKDNLCDLQAALDYAAEKHLVILPTGSLFNMGKCERKTLEAEMVEQRELDKVLHRHFSKIKNMTYDQFEEFFFTGFTEPVRSNEKGLKCDAGRNGFSINWKGFMTPCVSMDFYQLDPRRLGFRESWKKIVDWANQVPVLEECNNCIFQTKCLRCVALHYGDMGEFGKVSPRFCFKVIYPEQAKEIQERYDRMHDEKEADDHPSEKES